MPRGSPLTGQSHAHIVECLSGRSGSEWTCYWKRTEGPWAWLLQRTRHARAILGAKRSRGEMTDYSQVELEELCREVSSPPVAIGEAQLGAKESLESKLGLLIKGIGDDTEMESDLDALLDFMAVQRDNAEQYDEKDAVQKWKEWMRVRAQGGGKAVHAWTTAPEDHKKKGHHGQSKSARKTS